MASLLLQAPSSTLSSTPTLFFLRNTHFVLSPTTSLKPFSSSSKKPLLTFKSLTVPFALTESEGSPKSLNEPDPDSQTLTLLQELADSFDLPVDYFGQLPQDLRLDLNDAAFDLSNGPVIDECGQELGETLLNISRAWEQADTSTSTTLVGKLPLLLSSLTGNSKSAFGKRLVSAGRRFQSMGQYGQGELQTLEEGQVKMQSRLEEEEEAKEVYCNLKPEDKLSHVTSVSRDTGGGLIMVGDGINDAPALAAATVGIVLAQRASATAIAVADVLLLQDNISGVPFCIAKSHQTTSLVKQNVALALSSIFLASLTSVLGFLPLWLTVLLHEGGTLLVCLNSIRALNDPTWSWRQNLVDMVDKFKSVIMFRRRHSTRPGTIEAAPL